MKALKTVRAKGTDEGFTLIEIVVAMLILGLLSLALLPLLIQGVQQSSLTATTATAVQTVQDQIDGARATASPNSCSAIATYVTTANAQTPATDARGVTLKITDSSTTCPLSTTKGVVTFTATVTRTDTNKVLATATTYIYVAS